MPARPVRAALGQSGHALAGGLLLAFGCGRPNVERPAADFLPPEARRSPAGEVVWEAEYYSPRRESVAAPLSGCRSYEQGLERAAELIAVRRARLGRPLELTEVHFALRSVGVPQVWPRVWTVDGHDLDGRGIQRELEAWSLEEPGPGERRCGLARATNSDGLSVVVALAVDAVADLEPLPAQARAGQWMTLRGNLLTTEFEGVSVLLLGPTGAPRSVSAIAQNGRIRSAFSFDERGLWRLQVGSEGPLGPRPVLEAWIFVDEAPYSEFRLTLAPGEEVWRLPLANQLPTQALLVEMVNRARQSEGLPPLHRDLRLDQLAQQHADAMFATRSTGHDVGDGPPAARVARAGVLARRVGENVARAQSAVQAHRALWQSPSHRSTLLSDFASVGIGVAGFSETSEGRQHSATDVWVCELFVD